MRTRFFSPFLLLFFSPLLALFCAAQARAHGDPIIVTATDGALTTDKPVYVSELEPAGFVLFTDVPGFEFHGFQPGDEMTFDIVDHLWYWNEAQGVTPAADGLELLVEWKTSPFPVVGVSHNPDYIPGNNPLKPGYVFETIDGQSSEHQHLLAYLFETTELPAGAYGIMLQVKSAGYESTPPFLIAFNEQLSPSAFQEGVGKIGEQAFFVDEPGIPGDFNGDELVDALDIDLLVAHRGADQPDIYDLVPDNIIDDLDAAYWVEQIVGTRFGDVNLDRAIDLADLNAVRNHFGSSGGWETGDFDGSGIVDLPDLNSVRNQFGFIAGSPVSEPGALVLLAISTATIPTIRRWRMPAQRS